MKRFGCIGKKLTHSFSKELHALLADYEYNLIELNEEDVGAFLEKRDFKAINVTIPYKQTVIPFLDEVSEIAQKIGAVNTIVNKNGKLLGLNTDYFGMMALISKTGLDLKDKKVLILGTGGTSRCARVVAKDLGASEVLVVSRQKTEGVITYVEAVKNHTDIAVIINTTPVGMFPEPQNTPIDISAFEKLEGVIDAIYNPLCSRLVLDALERGLKASGGLYMLVAQAVVAVESFLDVSISKEKTDEVYTKILKAKENIVLTGMPGSGKSTVGRLIKIDGFSFVDTDSEIEKLVGCSVKDLISEKGEEYFRDIESRVLADLSLKTGLVIATGGGAVLRKENVRALKQNGKIYCLDAPLSRLCATETRPLSDSKEKLEKLYNERKEIYKTTADIIVPDLDATLSAEYILSKRREDSGFENFSY